MLADAVPGAVAQFTLTVEELDAPSVTVKTADFVPEWPSTMVTSLIDRATTSSLTRVAMPALRLKVAPLAFQRLSQNVSLLSTAVSPRTGTETVLLVSPGLNVRVPLVLV